MENSNQQQTVLHSEPLPKITQEDFIEIAQSLDTINYLMQDLQEEYFNKFNPESKSDERAIIWEFSRNRARTSAIQNELSVIGAGLTKTKISCYQNDYF